MHPAPETKDSRSLYFIPGEFVDLEAGIFTQRSWSVQVKANSKGDLRNEQSNQLAAASTCRWSASDDLDQSDGGNGLPLGRRDEICVCQSGCRTIYQAR